MRQQQALVALKHREHRYTITHNPNTRAGGAFSGEHLIRNLHTRKRSRDEAEAVKVSHREQAAVRKETKLRNEIYPKLRLWKANVESLDRTATSFVDDAMKYLTENVSGEML
jgi:hypothetical protein